MMEKYLDEGQSAEKVPVFSVLGLWGLVVSEKKRKEPASAQDDQHQTFPCFFPYHPQCTFFASNKMKRRKNHERSVVFLEGKFWKIWQRRKKQWKKYQLFRQWRDQSAGNHEGSYTDVHDRVTFHFRLGHPTGENGEIHSQNGQRGQK